MTVAAGVSGGLLLFLCAVLLTPTLGTVVGYENEQPPLAVEHHAEPPHPEDVPGILEVAKLHFEQLAQGRDYYWPEPSAITENKDCWVVAFTRKQPIYRFLGFRQSLKPTDQFMFLSIDKRDLSARHGRWCQ